MILEYLKRKGFAEGFANAFLEGYRDTLGRQLKDRELKNARFSIVRYLKKKGIEEESIDWAIRSLPTVDAPEDPLPRHRSDKTHTRPISLSVYPELKNSRAARICNAWWTETVRGNQTEPWPCDEVFSFVSQDRINPGKERP